VVSFEAQKGPQSSRFQACERLLEQRVEVKMKGAKVQDVLNRLHVAVPQARDGKARPPVLPPGMVSVPAAAAAAASADDKPPCVGRASLQCSLV
jgi:nucleolar GTP-binding protein